MFLLFRNYHCRIISVEEIYIPICFYYFHDKDFFTLIFVEIYIPICFYYFQISHHIYFIFNRYLHSNMFLLFRASVVSSSKSQGTFTFQYVSIISDNLPEQITILKSFTFQYVSIISMNENNMPLSLMNLHSNMFLLFLYCVPCSVSSLKKFTFQYVSIISTFANFISTYCISIYIPICFYYFRLYF